MENLHIGEKSKLLLKHIYVLASNNPSNCVNECLPSELATYIDADKEFACKCLCYMVGKGQISGDIACGDNGGKEMSLHLTITAIGIDLVEGGI